MHLIFVCIMFLAIVAGADGENCGYGSSRLFKRHLHLHLHQRQGF